MLNDISTCKCDQGKAILDGIEFQVSKIILKGILHKSTWALRLGLRMSVSVTQHHKVRNGRKCIF